LKAKQVILSMKKRIKNGLLSFVHLNTEKLRKQSEILTTFTALIKKKSITLIELMIVIVMLTILTGATAYVYLALSNSWVGQETRAGVHLDIDRGIEEMARNLREATAVQSAAGSNEIRFTKDGGDYIYYLYNVNDSYPPAFSEGFYELRKAGLSSMPADLQSKTFTYGAGKIAMRDIASPAASSLSVSGNMAVIDLSITRGNETIRSRTQVKVRNL